jgi:hypothetical protein
VSKALIFVYDEPDHGLEFVEKLKPLWTIHKVSHLMDLECFVLQKKSSLTSRQVKTNWKTKYKSWTQAHRKRRYGSGEARADPSDVSVYNSEMKFGRIAINAIDGVHVLRAGRHYNNHIAQCLQFDPVLWLRDSGLKSRAAIWGDGDIHPQIKRIWDGWRLKADGHKGHAQVICAVVVILLAAKNFVTVDIAAGQERVMYTR